VTPGLSRYVALGDSFTAGAAGAGVPSFGDRLAEILREANPSLDYLNLAAPGALTAEIFERQLPVALELEPSIVTASRVSTSRGTRRRWRVATTRAMATTRPPRRAAAPRGRSPR
jgi:hypothetical protein